MHADGSLSKTIQNRQEHLRNKILIVLNRSTGQRTLQNLGHKHLILRSKHTPSNKANKSFPQLHILLTLPNKHTTILLTNKYLKYLQIISVFIDNTFDVYIIT